MGLDALPTDDRAAQRDVLIADALGTYISDTLPDEQLAVMIETPPKFAPATLVEALAAESSYIIGVAMVNIDEAETEPLQAQCEGTQVRLTDNLATAIQWRNRSETAFQWDRQTALDRIAVFVRGDPAKLGSFHRLRSVPLGHIRKQVCNLMASRLKFANNRPSQAL